MTKNNYSDISTIQYHIGYYLLISRSIQSWWFRLFKYGIAARNIQRHPLLFSERKGYKKYLLVNNWLFEFIRRSTMNHDKIARIEEGIIAGTDKYFGYDHFHESNMADYTLMSYAIRDITEVYGILPEEAAEIVSHLTHA